MRKLVLLAALAVSGCASGPDLPSKVAFVGQSATLQSGVQVNIQDSWARQKELTVKLWVVNFSPALMYVNRDEMAIRTADGRIARRVGAIHDVYPIPPGGGHEVNLKFIDPGFDMRTNQGVSLIVGGISFSTDPRPRVVGEIPLVAAGPHR